MTSRTRVPGRGPDERVASADVRAGHASVRLPSPSVAGPGGAAGRSFQPLTAFVRRPLAREANRGRNTGVRIPPRFVLTAVLQRGTSEQKKDEKTAKYTAVLGARVAEIDEEVIAKRTSVLTAATALFLAQAIRNKPVAAARMKIRLFCERIVGRSSVWQAEENCNQRLGEVASFEEGKKPWKTSSMACRRPAGLQRRF